MKNVAPKPKQYIKTLKKGSYDSLDNALNEKHKNATDFIKKVTLKF